MFEGYSKRDDVDLRKMVKMVPEQCLPFVLLEASASNLRTGDRCTRWMDFRQEQRARLDMRATVRIRSQRPLLTT